ncbi:histidine phosphatase family protein [Nocardia transvalensis]|uniref:histidine phosphatase family protein n=1 Tax=Nocardia transvalensis TaxID=37333 RepID=UPI0018953F4E|nr:histidine phosphatase family protein [Nocardia transvalensis]MBF6333492.1 histidine phosphatase family protein [Nocardia transvalensis]
MTDTATELLIARHGESWCNTHGIIGGRTGCRGLTARGRTQARLLGQRLRERQAATPIHRLYTTPLRRAQETAAIVAAAVGLESVIEPHLLEQDHGSGDGRPWTEVVTAFGHIPALCPDRPLTPDGETWAHYLHRATAAIDRILTSHPGECILIIGHGETADAAFHHFLGLPAASRGTATVALHYTGLSIWQRQPLSWTRPTAGSRWTLITHNDAAHLASIDRPPLSWRSERPRRENAGGAT